MSATFLRSIAISCLLALSACACPRGGVDSSSRTTDSTYLGDWRSVAGTDVKIEAGRGGSFVITVVAPNEKNEFRGHLLAIDGTHVAEISVYDPGAETSPPKDAVPVFHYALVTVSGDTMTHAPLRPEWLKGAVQGTAGAVYGSTSQIVGGSGSVVVKDAAMMKELLTKAVHDAGAFGPTDTLTRVR